MWPRRKDKGTTDLRRPEAGQLAATSPESGCSGEPSDALLIERTLAGDTEAFGELVVRYQDRLYGTLVHVSGNPDEAREIAQDAFVQALVKLDTFQHTATFYTWLFRIAFNLRIGRKRRERRHRTWEEHQAAAGPGNGAAHEPGRRLEAAECARGVRAAIDALADDHREVLLLREMEGCPYEEISRILDVPLGTVRSRLHRARAHLRDILRPVHEQHLK
jgi:RNA polymerase sigma-70 factor (ECF subfamily)